jgi:hypothetical protein
VPDRLLDSYARALARLRKQVDGLGITAFVRWSTHPAFDDLTASVDEIVPQFFDYEKDSADDLRPLVDPAALHELISAWKKCRIPWSICLPWFSRASVYASSGEERERAKAWSWDDLTYNPELVTTRATNLGMTVMKARRPTRVGVTNVRADETVAVRRPDLDALAAVEKEAAHDVIYRSLPSPENNTTWSIEQAANLGSGEKPRLVIEPGAGFTLLNNSGADLPPRIDASSSAKRGYAIEIMADTTIFRDLRPGDFHHFEGRGDPEVRGKLSERGQSEDMAVTLVKASRVLLYFSHLPAGRSLKTRLFQLTPGTPATQLRFRIKGLAGYSGWQNVPMQ